MKHLSYYIHPFVLNITIAIISMICGLIVCRNNEKITDFELIIITISVFILIKGIIAFVYKVWLR
jgi:hypothetical protein